MAELSEQELVTLRTVPMFSSLSDEAITLILSKCPKFSFKPHEIICRAEEPARFFYAIVRGHVRVFKLAPTGEQQVLHLFGPGQTFAEAATMKGDAYPAHAEAVDNVVVIGIDKATFDAGLQKNIEMVAGMVAGLTTKLKELASLAEDLALKKVPCRLASVLLEEHWSAQSHTFKLSKPKKIIAEQIGTTPETLSRTLKIMKEKAIIEIKGAQITILDESALENMASGLE